MIKNKKAIKARKEGLRARSAYKLIELNKKYNIIKKGNIIDLGAYPGGWSVVASKYGRVTAIDKKKMQPIQGVKIIRGDFFNEETIQKLPTADTLLCDAAPATTGVRMNDSAESARIAEQALNIAKKKLRKGGNFVCKVFQGEEFEKILKAVKKEFEFAKATKPPTSKKNSKEMYIIAKNKLKPQEELTNTKQTPNENTKEDTAKNIRSQPTRTPTKQTKTA